MNADATYESVGPSEIVYDRKANNSAMSMHKKISPPIDAPPPPPLPPMPALIPIARNQNRDSTDSLADSIDFNQVDDDNMSLESDSGLEVVEEPTLRPSELVRGNNNRSMSIISGELPFIRVNYACR